MYNGMYMPYNQQVNLDRINNQIRELENMRNQYQGMAQQQMPSSTGITQNFQLAPNNQNTSKINYAESIEDVKKELVFGDTLFINKEYSQLWLKTAQGDVRIFTLNEYIPADPKDIEIAQLKAKIDMLEKGSVKNESNEYVNANDDEKSTRSKPTSVQSNK